MSETTATGAESAPAPATCAGQERCRVLAATAGHILAQLDALRAELDRFPIGDYPTQRLYIRELGRAIAYADAAREVFWNVDYHLAQLGKDDFSWGE